MFVALAVFSVVAVFVVVAMIVFSRRPTVPDRLRQTEEPGASDRDLPLPGSHQSAHRDDGSPVPGSQEYRNRRGRE